MPFSKLLKMTGLMDTRLETYRRNAAAGRAEIDAVMGQVATLLVPVRDMNFLMYHDAIQYFEARFGLRALGAISQSDASDPSPARIAEIQARVAEQGVTCVLSEPQFDPGIVAAVMDGGCWGGKVSEGCFGFLGVRVLLRIGFLGI